MPNNLCRLLLITNIIVGLWLLAVGSPSLIHAQEVCFNVCAPAGCSTGGAYGDVYGDTSECHCGVYCYDPHRPETNNVGTSCGCSPCYCPNPAPTLPPPPPPSPRPLASPTPPPAIGQPATPPPPADNTSGSAGAPYCGDGYCDYGDSCSSCPSDCGVCTITTGAYCGDAVCNSGETCSSCARDCGACCGNGICSGLESCKSCSLDCDVCSTAWWQAKGGHVFAGLDTGLAIRSIIPLTCLEPSCIQALLAPDLKNTPASAGIPITGGGQISANGFVNADNIQVRGSQMTRLIENYSLFYRQFGLPLNPEDDFASQATDARQPIAQPFGHKLAYFHKGDLTVQQGWNVEAGEKIVVFIDGDLTFTDPSNTNRLTQVAEGGFLAFIVSGNISIEANVGNDAVLNTTSNLEGVFIANGIISILSTGNTSIEQRFVGTGTFAGYDDVVLGRDLGLDNNATIPAEQFIFRHDFVRYLPEQMKLTHTLWQETN